MANQRAADQVFIGIWVTASIARKIELARGGTPRSQWVRDAIAELLRARGFEVTPAEVAAPSRVRVDLDEKAKISSAKIEKIADHIVEESVRKIRNRRKPAP